MNKKEFENNYTNRSGITMKEYQEWFVTLPCECGESNCEGWAAVHANYHSVGSHVDLYMLSDENTKNYFNNEDSKTYDLSINGCHDVTEAKVSLTDREYETLVKIADVISSASKDECQPTLGVYKVGEKEKEEEVWRDYWRNFKSIK